MIGFIESRDMYNIHDVGKFRSSGVKHVKTTYPFSQYTHFARVELHRGFIDFFPNLGPIRTKVLADLHYSSLLTLDHLIR